MSKGKYTITRIKYWDNTNKEVVSRKTFTRTDDIEAYKAKFKAKMKPIQVGYINLEYREVGTKKGGRAYVVDPQVVYDYHRLNPDLTLKDISVVFGISIATVSNYITEVFKSR